MVTFSRSKWTLGAATLVIWAIAAASAVYWVLRVSVSRETVAVVPLAAPQVTVDPLQVARLLGARPSSPIVEASLASRFSLQGVVSGTPGGGAALIAVDGKPAKPFRVGSPVDEGLVLQSATPRSVTLAQTRDGPALVTLDMPLLK